MVPAVAFMLVLGLSGCLSFVDPLEPGDAPDAGSAYLVGSFTMSNYFRKNVVISIKNVDTGKTRMIKLRGYADRALPGEITAIELEPGRYSFDEMIACPAVRSFFTLEKMDCTPRRRFGCDSCGRYSAPFTVEKGKAYFAGNFSGVSYAKDGGTEVVWEIQVDDKNIDDTAYLFRQRYPKFGSVPVVPAFR